MPTKSFSWHPFLQFLIPCLLLVLLFLAADVPVEKLAAMEALQSVNLKSNPLSEEVRVIARPLIKFDLLMSPAIAHV